LGEDSFGLSIRLCFLCWKIVFGVLPKSLKFVHYIKVDVLGGICQNCMFFVSFCAKVVVSLYFSPSSISKGHKPISFTFF